MGRGSGYSLLRIDSHRVQSRTIQPSGLASTCQFYDHCLRLVPLVSTHILRSIGLSPPEVYAGGRGGSPPDYPGAFCVALLLPEFLRRYESGETVTNAVGYTVAEVLKSGALPGVDVVLCPTCMAGCLAVGVGSAAGCLAGWVVDDLVCEVQWEVCRRLQ